MKSLERLAFGLFALMMIILVMAIITTLQGCSALHPSDRTPDATWVASDGHTYHGWRTGRKASVAHAGGCPHPDHVRMQPDTIYANQTTQEK